MKPGDGTRYLPPFWGFYDREALDADSGPSGPSAPSGASGAVASGGAVAFGEVVAFGGRETSGSRGARKTLAGAAHASRYSK